MDRIRNPRIPDSNRSPLRLLPRVDRRPRRSRCSAASRKPRRRRMRSSRFLLPRGQGQPMGPQRRRQARLEGDDPPRASRCGQARALPRGRRRRRRRAQQQRAASRRRGRGPVRPPQDAAQDQGGVRVPPQQEARLHEPLPLQRFLGLYLGILYEQTQAESAYGIVWTMQNSIVPQNENTDEDQLVYSSKDNVFEWIKGTFAPIWADPKCGDGECSRQTEYPGFGKFGCTADCGPYPAEFLSTLHIDIQPSYKVDETDAVMSDLGDKFLSESPWNLCTKQLEKDDKTGAAVESCWYALEQKFRARAGRTERSIISPRARHGLVREAQDALRRHPRHRVRGRHLHHSLQADARVRVGLLLSHVEHQGAQNHRGGGWRPRRLHLQHVQALRTPSSRRPPRAAVASPTPAAAAADGRRPEGFALAQGIHQSHVRARRAARLQRERRELARRRKLPPRPHRHHRRRGRRGFVGQASAAPPAPDVLRGEDHVHRRAGQQRR